MINKHRVRTLTRYLEYGDLSKRKIIPKERMFTSKTVPGRGGKTPCPTLAKKLGASSYGLFMEKVIENILSNDKRSLLVNELPQELHTYFKPDSFQDIADVIDKEIISKGIIVQPQVEFDDPSGRIVGHPDLVSFDTVYEIKTTGRFSAMRIDTIFQLLSYFCLAQKLGLAVKKIALVLPLQLKVVTYDLSEWEWEPFYHELNLAIEEKLQRESLWYADPISNMLFMNKLNTQVGSHCHLSDLLVLVKQNFAAVQFFISGNVTTKVNYTPKFKKDLTESITNSITPVFIHSPYILNLSSPGGGKMRTNDDKIKKEVGIHGGWTFKCLKDILLFGAATGIKGVVVHCGKKCKSSEVVAINHMWYSISVCAQWATPNCKLLIETSSGDGGEILCQPEQLAKFYLSLEPEVKAVIGICVDTCHVFAAGYKPHEYILTLTKLGVPIDLIHYNDSLKKQGSFKDRHAPIGHGYVGFEQLNAVVDFAILHKIPMVTE